MSPPSSRPTRCCRLCVKPKRASPTADPPLHIVLHRPEIPNNTGTIGRLCVATGCALHLIHPLGFSTDDKACRRAGLDYWPRLDVREHAAWDDFVAAQPPSSGLWLMTTRAASPIFEVNVRLGDCIVFGSETSGLPTEILDAHPDRLVCLPMVAGERSQNLAIAVAAAAYEGIRQQLTRGELALDESGRLITQISPDQRAETL